MEIQQKDTLQIDFRFYQTLKSIVQWSKILGIIGIADGIVSLLQAILLDKGAIAIAVLQLVLYAVLYGYLFWGGQKIDKALNTSNPDLLSEGFSGLKVFMQIQTVIIMLAALIIVLAVLFITILSVIKM
ncbi:MAG: hypothetical protein MUE72_09615 [Chitinophagaceae bacterium]|jgi:hypothetical protein|nr:hypothetical protein [Chitinophagaceae bacterium]